MSDVIVVLCTCPERGVAERIADVLVTERLCACVNILPGVQSVYRWQGNVEHAAEVLLLIKSTEATFSALRERLVQIHSYDTPEIIALPVATGAEAYLRWVRDQV